MRSGNRKLPWRENPKGITKRYPAKGPDQRLVSMNVNLDSLTEAIKQVEKKHATDLRGQSGKSQDFENGFVRGLLYVREYIIPAFETVELEESLKIEEHMQNAIEDLKAKHRFGL